MSETTSPRQDSMIETFRNLPPPKKRLAVLMAGIFAFSASAVVIRDLETRNDAIKYTRGNLIKTYNHRAGGAKVLKLVKPEHEGGPYTVVVNLPNCTNNHSAITEDNSMLEVQDQLGNKNPIAKDNVGAFMPLPGIDAYDVGVYICENLK